MIYEKSVKLLKQVINNKYNNIEYENIYSNEEEFYYEFKLKEIISENDFEI